jgi:hypothetical protein
METPTQKLEERFKEIPEREFVQNAADTSCEDERSNEIQINSNDDEGNECNAFVSANIFIQIP